ncbi:MAG: lipoyl synthase [Ruminiclostridium sp.]
MTKSEFPEWLKIKISSSNSMNKMQSIIEKYSLHTVCKQANCPNIGECFKKNTATFLILGKNCTRRCKFCNISKGVPLPIDKDESENIARAVAELQLTYVVVTSVTRDDLLDGGASQFFYTVRAIKRLYNTVTIEILVPDFGGNEKSLITVLEAEPNVIAHNIETVPSLYHVARPQASYESSLNLLSRAKKINSQIVTKSSFMVGLGESYSEVLDLMKDLKNVGCDILTIGQYLKPSPYHLEIFEYVHPDTFKEYKKKAYEIGFKQVEADPLVRSSYKAAATYANYNKS